MFGFGLFSTHLPYLVLLAGYIACWLWSAQTSPEKTADTGRPEKVAEFNGQTSEIGNSPVFHPFSTGLSAEPSHGDEIPPPVIRETKKAISPFLCNNTDPDEKTFVFLRPPPGRVS